MRTHLVFIGSFLTAATLAIALLAGSDSADAAQMRSPASICTINNAVDATDIFYWGRVEATDTVLMECPFVESEDLRHNNVLELALYVYDGANNATVEVDACRMTFDYTSNLCGTTAATSSPGTGYSILTPGLTTWQASNTGVAYIQVILPEPTGATDSWMSGYYADDT